jgi:hypothetical protein
MPEPGTRGGAGPVSAGDSGAGREKLGFPLVRPGQDEPDRPYMDPDGTLHNLKPIGRLATSGPDTEPRRYSDTALGSGWFVAKTSAKAEGAADPDASGTAGGTTAEAANGSGGNTAQGSGPTAGDDATAADAQQAAPGAQQAAPGANPAANGGDTNDGDSSSGTTGGGEGGNAAAPWDARSAQQGPELAPHLPLTAADLSAIRWRLDGGTLREVVDNRDALRELGERLDGPLADEADNIVKAGLLSVRAEVYRLLGELGMAAAASRLALAHAESAHDLQSMVIAQAELAHVLRLRGDYMEADRLFQRAVESGVSPAVRSVVHENAGRSCFDQGRHMEALDHFARAVRLGAPEDTDLVERIGVCLEAVYIHVLRDGWGPYPRKSPEILTPLTGRLATDGEPEAGGQS